MLDRVPGALVPDDSAGPRCLSSWVQRAGNLLENVEELAADELRSHPVEHRPAATERGIGKTAHVQQLIAPAQTQVTQQHGGSVAKPGRISAPAVLFVDSSEPSMYRWHSAAGVGSVDQVVVDQGSGLKELQARRGVDDGLLVGSTSAPPAPVTECRSKPLATGQQIRGGVDQRQQIGTLRPEHRALPLEVLVENPLHSRP